MQQGLLHLHNFMRWIVLLFALLTLIRAIRGITNKAAFTKGDRLTAMFLMISTDIQLLLGLALYYMKGWLDVLANGADVMSNKYNRFYAIEHAVGMIVAIVLIHIGYSSVKKSIPDLSRFRRLFWYTLFAVIIILVTIPWPGRELIGRPLFPGMH